MFLAKMKNQTFFFVVKNDFRDDVMYALWCILSYKKMLKKLKNSWTLKPDLYLDQYNYVDTFDEININFF